jgi:hypothetical protein
MAVNGRPARCDRLAFRPSAGGHTLLACPRRLTPGRAYDPPEWVMPPQMIGAAHARGARAVSASAAVFDDPPREIDLRFRLRFSDGREAAQDDEAGLRTGRGPILMLSGSQNSYGGACGIGALSSTVTPSWPPLPAHSRSGRLLAPER